MNLLYHVIFLTSTSSLTSRFVKPRLHDRSIQGSGLLKHDPSLVYITHRWHLLLSLQLATQLQRYFTTRKHTCGSCSILSQHPVTNFDSQKGRTTCSLRCRCGYYVRPFRHLPSVTPFQQRRGSTQVILLAIGIRRGRQFSMIS